MIRTNEDIIFRRNDQILVGTLVCVFNFPWHNALNARIKENLGPTNIATKPSLFQVPGEEETRGLCLAIHTLGLQIHSSNGHVRMILKLETKRSRPSSYTFVSKKCFSITSAVLFLTSEGATMQYQKVTKLCHEIIKPFSKFSCKSTRVGILTKQVIIRSIT